MEDSFYSDFGPVEEKKQRVGGYRVLALVVALLTIGGLFLGLLGKAVSLFTHTLYASEGGFLGGSLLGYAIAFVRSLPAIFEVLGGMALEGLLSAFIPLLLIALLAVSVLLSVILMIVSFVSRKAARKSALVSGYFSLVAYGLLALYAYSTISISSGGFSRALFDVPTLCIAGALLVAMAVTAIAEKKVLGLLNTLLLVFALAIVFAFTYPLSFTGVTLLAPFSALDVAPFYYICLLVFAFLLLFNLIVSTVRLTAEKAFVFDAVRYGLQLVVALLLIVSSALMGEGGWSWAFFGNGTLLPSIILIIACLGALFLSLVLILLARGKKAVAAEEDETDDVDDFDVMYDREFAASEPDTFVAPAPEPEPEPEPTPEPEPEPAPEPEPEPEEELSDFERAMLASAEEGKPTEPAAPAPEPEPAPQPTYPPFNRPQQYAPQPPMPSYDYGSQYTYDPFITTLTEREKNEFGDLFIARKRGIFGSLPVYRIGGDNTEFFNKVWIHYAMYDMSPQLKDKIFNYVRSLRMK